MNLISIIRSIFPLSSKINEPWYESKIAETLNAPNPNEYIDIQDQFSPLYANFDDYRILDRCIDSDTALVITWKTLQPLQPLSYIYRWMWLSIPDIREICNKGMLKDKVNSDDYDEEDGEDEKVICFTDRAYAYNTIQRAAQWEDPQLSFIFEVPVHLLQNYSISINWSGDVMRIAKDIPFEIIQESNIYVVNYKNKTLEKISIQKEEK